MNSFSWCKRINPSIHMQYIYDLQFTNYSIEKKQLSSIKSISKIENHVSKKVKNQYEENPYPRWTNLGLSVEARNIKEVFKYKELNISLEKDNFPKKIEILVAGCGTGQHAITSASVYKNAKIYALDLSFNSLSYAKRKAQELGLRNMSFIQGDLLDLEKLNRKFDLIECVGVLHHMDDPFLGWKTLTKNIKNNSLMYIGLYSKKARENISRIRTKINNLKIKTTKENITSFRKDMIKNFKTEWRSIENSPDFYSTSGVRDLLFHVQEHQFTISKIRKYMEDLNLVFVGFEDTYITERFKKFYSNPHDLYSLDKWEEFEINNPRIFSGMYQFWCKKI